MQLPPVPVVLSWPTPNYENPITRGPALIIVNTICITLTVLTVVARLYTRIAIKRWFGIDDVFILLALLFTLALTIVVLLANQSYGWNRHVWDIPFAMFVPASKIAMTAKIVFTAAATFTRLSLHCFYYRLVSDTGKSWFKWLVHFNVTYTIGIFLTFTSMATFLCIPVSNYWTLGAPADTCINEAVATLVCGIVNCVADLLTTVTPIALVMSLEMPLRQRMAVALLFGMSLLVTAAGAVRTWYIYRSLFNEYDETWYAYPLWIAAAVEIDLGVICASAPVLKPLLEKIAFGLSSALTGGIFFIQTSLHTCKTLTPGASATFTSKRKSAAPQSVPELNNDKGHSYEMKNWTDEARMESDLERGREGSGYEDQPKRGIARLLDKIWSSLSSANKEQQPTMTLTSQLEVKSESVSSRHPRSRRHGILYENHMPIPPLPPLRSARPGDYQ